MNYIIIATRTCAHGCCGVYIYSYYSLTCFVCCLECSTTPVKSIGRDTPQTEILAECSREHRSTQGQPDGYVFAKDTVGT